MIGVGDLVVCIKREAWKLALGIDFGQRRPRYGEVCRVTEAFADGGWAWLRLADFDHNGAFAAHNFRPLNDSHHDNELVERIKNCGRAPADLVHTQAMQSREAY